MKVRYLCAVALILASWATPDAMAADNEIARLRAELDDANKRLAAAQAHLDAAKSALETLQELLDAFGGGTPDTTGIGPRSELKTGAEITEHLDRMMDAANTVTNASTIDGSSFLFNVTVLQPKPEGLTLDSLADGAEFQASDTINGVSTAIKSGESLAAGNSYVSLAGWLDHNFFLVIGNKSPSGSLLDPDPTLFSAVSSIGNATGTNPVPGSATWRGAMAAIDVEVGASTFGNLVTGDAHVTIADFAVPEVGIAFTNIRDTRTNAQHDPITWQGMTLKNGAFADHVDTVTGNTLADPFTVELTGQQPPPGALFPGQISGHFYGPNHEEVGGTFERNDLNGAFGAKRQ